MNIRTNLHAGQDGTTSVDPAEVKAMVDQLGCKVSPLEAMSLANKYCSNLDPKIISQLMQKTGVSGGPSALFSLFGGG